MLRAASDAYSTCEAVLLRRAVALERARAMFLRHIGVALCSVLCARLGVAADLVLGGDGEMDQVDAAARQAYLRFRSNSERRVGSGGGGLPHVQVFHVIGSHSVVVTRLSLRLLRSSNQILRHSSVQSSPVHARHRTHTHTGRTFRRPTQRITRTVRPSRARRAHRLASTHPA